MPRLCFVVARAGAWRSAAEEAALLCGVGRERASRMRLTPARRRLEHTLKEAGNFAKSLRSVEAHIKAQEKETLGAEPARTVQLSYVAASLRLPRGRPPPAGKRSVQPLATGALRRASAPSQAPAGRGPTSVSAPAGFLHDLGVTLSRAAPIVYDNKGQDGSTVATVPHAGSLGGETFNADELRIVKEETARTRPSMRAALRMAPVTGARRACQGGRLLRPACGETR